MKNGSKLAVWMGFLSLLSVMPLAAQIATSVNFTTAFPFYAGNAKMSAGSYKIIPSGETGGVLEIQTKDGTHAVLVDITPTYSGQPHTHSDVTFRKYGDTAYLDRIWVEGQEYGMKAELTKAETKAAANATVVEHSLSGN